MVCLVAIGESFAQEKPPQDDAEAIFRRAVQMHQAGDLEGAIQAYRVLLDAFPDSVEVRSNLGAAYASLGRYQDAIGQYQKALDYQPGNSDIRFNLGLAFHKAAQFRDAAAELEKVVAAQPENKRAVLLLADCYLALGKDKKVIELLSPREAAFNNDRAFLYVLGTALIRDQQTAKGQVLIDRILREGDSAEARLLLGMAHLLVSDYPGALDELTRAVQLNPKLPGVHALYGRALLANAKHDEAVAAFRQELQLNPNDFEANYYLGTLLRQDGDFEQALRYLRRSLDLRPEAIDPRYQVGMVYVSQEKLEEARQTLEGVVKDAPAFTDAHVALAKLYFRLKRPEDGNREQAIIQKLNAETAQRVRGLAEGRAAAYQADPLPQLHQPNGTRSGGAGTAMPAAPPTEASKNAAEPFDALASRAHAAREANRLDEAIDLYQQLVQLRPSWTEGWWYLGTIHYEAGRFSQGRDAFARVVSLEPKGGPGWALLGLCEYELKQYDAALAHLQRGRAMGLGGSKELSRVARFHTGILQSHFGQFEAAQQQLFPLARDSADNQSLREALGIAALRLPWFPAEIPADQRPLVKKAGRAAYFQAARIPDDARREFTELIASYPHTAHVHYSFGVFLLIQNPDEALEEFRRELEITPTHVPARLQIAFEYIKRGKAEEGLPFAEQAVKLAPDSFAARNALGRIYFEMGRTDQAIEQLEKGVRLEPGSPETRWALARAYARAGRKEEAARERAEFAKLKDMQRQLQGVPQPMGRTDDQAGEKSPL